MLKLHCRESQSTTKKTAPAFSYSVSLYLSHANGGEGPRIGLFCLTFGKLNADLVVRRAGFVCPSGVSHITNKEISEVKMVFLSRYRSVFG